MKKPCNNALLSSAVDIGIRYSYSHVYNVGVGYLRNTQVFLVQEHSCTHYAVRSEGRHTWEKAPFTGTAWATPASQFPMNDGHEESSEPSLADGCDKDATSSTV